MNKCGIVFLNTNDGARTARLINCIKDYKSIARIIIVDNCSNDNSLELLSPYVNERIEIVKTDRNKGYSYGNNIGIKKLLEYDDIDIIGIANTDVEFSSDLISKLMVDFEKNDQYGMLAGLQLTPENEIACHPFWGLKDTWKSYLYAKLGCLALLSRIFRIYPDQKYISERAKNTAIFEVGTVEGSFFLIRRKLFEDIGLFDDNVFLYCEEDIIGIKMKKTQYITCVDPRVSYIHYGGQTTKTLFTNVRKIKLENESKHYYLKTYVSDNPLVLFIDRVISSIYVFETHLRNFRNKYLRRGSQK